MSAKICRKCMASTHDHYDAVVLMTKQGPAWFCSPKHRAQYRPWLDEVRFRFRYWRRHR